MAGPASSAAAGERVWRSLPPGARQALEDQLSPTDLQTLLLMVARARARRVRLPGLVERWQSDRFVRPSDVDPRQLAEVELRIWRLLPPEVIGLDLSPVAPLGTCSRIASIDQNRVVSTVRSSEVVSDPTNVLAIEASTRRRRSRSPVHLAACHRVLRGQRYDAPGTSQHFKLFALVSTDRDSGSAHTEAQLMITHLQFWRSVLAAFQAVVGRVAVTVIGNATLQERLADTVMPALGGIDVVEDPDRTGGIGYYRSAAFKIISRSDGHQIELGDGGFTDWTAKLMADAKERCLVSCLSTERLTQMISGQR